MLMFYQFNITINIMRQIQLKYMYIFCIENKTESVIFHQQRYMSMLWSILNMSLSERIGHVQIET